VEIDTGRVDSALLDLEGILLALDMVRMEDGLNKPGPEFHALAVLSKLAVEQTAKLRLAIFPETPKREEGTQC
jgi:hypothetical protein